MNAIGKSAKVCMKILEVGHWVATGLMAAAAILSLAAPHLLGYVMNVDSLSEGGELSAYGFTVFASPDSGEIYYPAVFLFGIGATVIFVLMALVFRHLYQIISKAESDTPFHADNIARLKRISIFCMIVPLVGIVMSILIRLIIGTDAAELSMDQSGIIMGIIVLCLTQYFIRGAQLEKDVDGLL